MVRHSSDCAKLEAITKSVWWSCKSCLADSLYNNMKYSAWWIFCCFNKKKYTQKKKDSKENSVLFVSLFFSVSPWPGWFHIGVCRCVCVCVRAQTQLCATVLQSCSNVILKIHWPKPHKRWDSCRISAASLWRRGFIKRGEISRVNWFKAYLSFHVLTNY